MLFITNALTQQAKHKPKLAKRLYIEQNDIIHSLFCHFIMLMDSSDDRKAACALTS